MQGENTGYRTSIDSQCSIYTAELSAVDKAIEFALINEWRDDLLILTDNQGAVKDVGNNSFNFNKHRVGVCIRVWCVKDFRV